MSAARKRRLRTSAFALAACVVPMLAGCSDSVQPFRPADPEPTPLPPPIVAPGFAALTQSGRIYAAEGSLDDVYTKYHGARLASRFVLYDDSTFALQFASGLQGLFEYDGRFTRVDSEITFIWQGWSTAGPWGAEGTLRGNSLSVAYNSVMQLTDFIDGTYRLSTPTP
jgi:hypothetical protein